MIKLPSGAPAPAARLRARCRRSGRPSAAPEPTPQRVGAADVQSVASRYGVSPSLAAAIAWQESGFNNGMVSDANARGVMQVMPGTWSYVEPTSPAGAQPASASDNVHAGVLYLKHLLAADRRRRERRDRRLLPGPRLGPLARPVRRHPAVRRQRAGAALALRGVRGRYSSGAEVAGPGLLALGPLRAGEWRCAPVRFGLRGGGIVVGGVLLLLILGRSFFSSSG